MFKLEFTFLTWQDAQAAMALMSGNVEAPTAAPAPAKAEAKKAIEKAAKVEAPKPTAAAVEAPVPTPAVSETATSATTESAESAPASASPSDAPSYDEVAALVIKFAKANGRPAAVEALKPFGITSFTQAKPEQFAAIAAALTLEEVAA